jgi:hypothetical protein
MSTWLSGRADAVASLAAAIKRSARAVWGPVRSMLRASLNDGAAGAPT